MKNISVDSNWSLIPSCELIAVNTFWHCLISQVFPLWAIDKTALKFHERALKEWNNSCKHCHSCGCPPDMKSELLHVLGIKCLDTRCIVENARHTTGNIQRHSCYILESSSAFITWRCWVLMPKFYWILFICLFSVSAVSPSVRSMS